MVNHRIKLKELLVTIRVDHNVQLMVCRDGRPDLPHLTINWGNPSKNINLHLTSNQKDNKKEYQQITPIPEAKLVEALIPFESELVRIVNALVARARPISPSWLRRRGYKILYLDETAEKRLCQRLVPKQKHGRKKKKWTHIPDEQIINSLDRRPELTECIHHPRKLREIAAGGYDKPIFAECMYGKSRGRVIVLALRHKPNGEVYWAALDIEELDLLLGATADFFWPVLSKLLPSDEFEKVYSALRLDEVGW